MSIIIASVATLGSLGLAYGLGLAFASKKFHVEVDPKIEKINDALPGANCAACGYAGCASYAEAVVKDGIDITLCAPGGPSTVDAISEIMGVTASAAERKIALIHCQSGGHDNTNFRYDYQGISTCKAAILVSSGPNVCDYGCVSQNDCIAVCKFDAIHLDDNGMRVIDKEKCTGCGACVKACPRTLIELVPVSKRVHIMCTSHDKGAIARPKCGSKTACIACTLCVKKCPKDAITMQNNLAVIDYEKCINCGMCADVCPTSAIIDPLKELRAKKKAAAMAKAKAAIAAKEAAAKKAESDQSGTEKKEN